MTAIAFRAGVMAADNVAWTASNHVKIPCGSKIIRLPDGGLIAGAGDTVDIQLFHKWVEGGCLEDKKPNFSAADGFSAMWAKADGTLWAVTWKLSPFEVHGSFFAIGMPSEFMMGALFAGASAEQAVQLAIDHTDGGGGTVQVERL